MGGQVLRIQMEGVPADVAEKLIEFIVDRINATQPKPDAALLAPSAEKRQGGIDLKNIAPTVRKEGRGVQMNMDPAMLERIKREGIDGLTPVIDRISPVQSIWPLVGLEPPN